MLKPKEVRGWFSWFFLCKNLRMKMLSLWFVLLWSVRSGTPISQRKCRLQWILQEGPWGMHDRIQRLQWLWSWVHQYPHDKRSLYELVFIGEFRYLKWDLLHLHDLQYYNFSFLLTIFIQLHLLKDFFHR